MKSPKPMDAASVAIATSSNAFAWALYAQLAAGASGQSLFFSPYSMTNALVMTAEGARDETAREMGNVLRLQTPLNATNAARPWDMESVHIGLSALNQRLAATPRPPEFHAELASVRRELLDANTKLDASRYRYDASTRELERTARELASRLNALLAQIDQYELRVANALWGERSVAIEKSYLDVLSKYYSTGGLFAVDFRGDPDGSRQQINAWVAERTQDKIKELIARGMITTDTRLVLTNAVYFKGEWAHPFNPAHTKDADFSKADGSKVRVAMMQQHGIDDARYAAFNGDASYFDTPAMVPSDPSKQPATYPDDDGFLVLELPYKGGELAMVMLAPQSASGLANLEARIDEASVAMWLAALHDRRVHVLMPKFTLETTYDISAALKTLGMKRAFVSTASTHGAQFDGISASADPTNRFYIGVVVHKAFLDVNETGTEAAAATAVAMMAGAGPPPAIPFTPTFAADRPFLLLIRHRASGAILFLGRVMDPS